MKTRQKYQNKIKLKFTSMMTIVFALFIYSSANGQNTYWVSNNGSASWSNAQSSSPLSGSSAASLATANDNIQPGDTVFVRGGTYNRSIDPSTSGTANAKITYKGYNSEMPFVQGNIGAGKGNPTKVNDRSYIVVDGFNLSTPILTYGAAVIFRGNYNELRNSLIDNPLTEPGMPESTNTSPHNSMGLAVGKSKFNLVDNTTVTGWWLGITAGDNAENLIVRNSVIAGNVHNQITIGPRPGMNSSNDPNPLRLLFENNIIGGSLTSDGIQTDSGAGTVVNMRGIIIRGNTFYFLGENALDFKAGGDILVENNIFVASLGDNDGNGVRGNSSGNITERNMGAITKGSNQSAGSVIVRNNVFYDNINAVTSSANDWKIYNNTIVANNRDAYGWNSSYAGDPWVPANFFGVNLNYNGNVLLNNIIVDHHDAAVIIGSTPTSRKARVDNNLYEDASGNLKFLKGKNSTLEEMTFSQWKNYLGLWSNIEGREQNSLVADPQFVNVPRSVSTFPYFNYTEATVGNPVYGLVLTFNDLDTWFPYDFSLQAGSPAIDAGGFLTATTNSGSNSTTLKVIDSRVFIDGYGIAGEGDIIQIGSETPVKIIAINYSTNTITLEATRNWTTNTNVSLPYNGSRPDIGAYEYSSALSINDENIENTITITPNPTSNTFTIDLGNETLKKVIIYNQLGQQVKKVTTNEVDISNLSNGIYFVKVTSQSGKTATKKIIKN
ncbi:MAG: T9SS type A sorting domain-containing protein [Flavobacteriaceae bacterium]|nr:T9SS type A sorting domain-containing protein [Flavobacteriaceae bacterium]